MSALNSLQPTCGRAVRSGRVDLQRAGRDEWKGPTAELMLKSPLEPQSKSGVPELRKPGAKTNHVISSFAGGFVRRFVTSRRRETGSPQKRCRQTGSCQLRVVHVLRIHCTHERYARHSNSGDAHTCTNTHTRIHMPYALPCIKGQNIGSYYSNPVGHNGSKGKFLEIHLSLSMLFISYQINFLSSNWL